jgi:hypothetical protein
MDTLKAMPIREQLRRAMPHIGTSVACRLDYANAFGELPTEQLPTWRTFEAWTIDWTVPVDEGDDGAAAAAAAAAVARTAGGVVGVLGARYPNALFCGRSCLLRANGEANGDNANDGAARGGEEADPVLALLAHHDEHDACTRAFTEYVASESGLRRALLPLYVRACARRVLLVTEQCFKADQYWANNTRKQKFEDTVHAHVRTVIERDASVEQLETIALPNASSRLQALADELRALYTRHLSIVYLYVTRNRNTLDLAKYKDACDRVFVETGVGVQLYNLREWAPLIDHALVPRHRQFDVWYDRPFIQRVCEHTLGLDLASLQMHAADESNDMPVLPVLSRTDAVAKFIGARQGNLCMVMRICQSGLYPMFRIVV